MIQVATAAATSAGKRGQTKWRAFEQRVKNCSVKRKGGGHSPPLHPSSQSSILYCFSLYPDNKVGDKGKEREKVQLESGKAYMNTDSFIREADEKELLGDIIRLASKQHQKHILRSESDGDGDEVPPTKRSKISPSSPA